MNVIVDKVYDKQRFAWFVHLRYGYTLPYAKTLANWIDKDYKHRLSNLTEAEVRYLQATNSCRYDSEYICKLKIIPTKMTKVKEVVGLKKSNPDNEPKQDVLGLLHVKFTKVIHYDEMLNEEQIQALLRDKNVKSINIEK